MHSTCTSRLLKSLYIGPKELYAGINGTQHDQTIPNISTGSSSVHDYSDGEQSPYIYYDDNPSINIDTQCN